MENLAKELPMRGVVFWVGVVFSNFATLAHAQDAKLESLVGQCVFIREDMVVEVDGKVLDLQRDFDIPAEVTEVAGMRVRVQRIWLERNQVMTVEEALAFYDEELKRDPSAATALRGRARCLLHRGEFAKAVLDLDAAIELNSRDWEALCLRGFAATELGDFSAAIQDFNEGLYYSRGNGDLLYGCARAKLGLNDDDGAKDLFKKLCRLTSKQRPSDFLMRGEAYLALEHYDLAVGQLNELLSLQPSNPRGYLNRAFARISIRDSEGAAADLQAAIKLHPRMVFASVARGLGAIPSEFQGVAIRVLKQRVDEKLVGSALVDQDSASKSANIEEKSLITQITQTTFEAYKKPEPFFTLPAKVDAAKKDVSVFVPGVAPTEDVAKTSNRSDSEPKNSLTRNRAAEAKLNSSDFVGAIKDCEEMLKLLPSDAWALFTRGKAYYNLNEYDSALADFDCAIESNNGEAKMWLWRANVKRRRKDQLGALKDLNEAIKLDPQDARTWLDRAQVKHALEDLEGALSDIDQSISLNAKEVAAWCIRGNFKNEKADFEGAIKDCDEAIRLRPKEELAYYTRSVANYQSKRFEAARADLDQLLELNPGHTSAWNARASAKAALGNYSEALHDLDEAIRLAPAASSYWLSRAKIKHLLKEFDSSLIDLNKSIELKPSNAEAWGLRGWTKFLGGDFEDALRDGDEALRLDPRDAATHLVRGQAYFQLQQFDRAVTEFDQSISIDGADPRYWIWRARAKSATRDLSGSLQDLQESLKLKPDDVESLFSCGVLKHDLGDLAGAMEELNKAIELAPEHAPALRSRGALHAKRGELELAKKDLVESIRIDSKVVATHISLSRVKAELKDYRGAIESLDETIRLEPAELEYHVARGALKYKSEDFSGAVADLDVALKGADGNLELLEYRAKAKCKLKDFTGAIADFDAMLRVDPKLARIFESRAAAKELAQDFAGAMNDLNEAIRLEPTNASYLTSRGFSKFAQHDYEGAIRDCDEAIKQDSTSVGPFRVKALVLATCDDAKLRSLTGAEEMLAKAMELAPDDARTKTARACVLALKGEYPGAIAIQKEALQDQEYVKHSRPLLGAADAAERIAAWEKGELWTRKKR